MAALRRISQVVIFALVALFPIVGDGKRGAGPEPVWRFDLKEVGYHRVDPMKAKVYALRNVRPKISFLGPDSVVAAFASGSPKQPPLTGTWTLHVVILDVRTGQLRLHKTFPIAGHEAGIFVTADNNLLVWLGRTLTLFSSDFQVVKQRELPKSSNPAWTQLLFSLSPSGRTLFVGSADPKTAEMLDTRTLESVAACKVSELDELPATITDRLAARLYGKKVLVSEFCKELLPIHEFVEASFPNNIHFLNDDSLAVGRENVFTLLRPNGTVLKTVTLAKKIQSENALASRDGRQFALVGVRIGGVIIPAFDMWGRRDSIQLKVYDTATEAERVALEVAPGNSEIAVSGDGAMIAAIADGDVRLFNMSR